MWWVRQWAAPSPWRSLRQPRLVRSLSLACTWAEGDGRFLHTLESWISLAYRVPIEERYRHMLYPWLFTPEFFAKKENVELAFQRSMADPYQTKAEAIDRQGRGIMAWNGTRLAKLGGVRVPTLVLVGRDDILTPPAFSRQVARAIRRARLVVMPGGHGFFLEHADQFNRTLLRFPEVGPLDVALGPANALGDGGRRLNVSRGT